MLLGIKTRIRRDLKKKNEKEKKTKGEDDEDRKRLRGSSFVILEFRAHFCGDFFSGVIFLNKFFFFVLILFN